ncbi:MAG: hypothetical protein HGA78_10060 [Nitrospirales bacterium]|nr:hypothetical protein [Nitrospirales bacterium]
MYAWEVRDMVHHRVRELLPWKSDHFYKTLSAFLCYKNCLSAQLYIYGTSSDLDKQWVYWRAFKYMKKVMLDWCDMKGIKDDVYPRRNELINYLFDIHGPLLEYHYYLYQIDYSHLASVIAPSTSSSPVNNFISARSLCNVLFNLEEYHYIWGDGDVYHHLRGRLNFYNGCAVRFDFEGLRCNPRFWEGLYSTMGYYREKYNYTKSLFAFPW